MKTNTFDILIQASPEKVWHSLWDDHNYSQWSSVFCDGSYFKGDWSQNSRMHFLAPTGDGMYSDITVCQPFETMNITHLGELKNTQEIPPEHNEHMWTGARENYSLTEVNGSTKLTVLVDLLEKYESYFSEKFPLALEKIKHIAENFMVTVETEIYADIDSVWSFWTMPLHVKGWNHASDDWHTPEATSDFQVPGKFSYIMAAKDGSFSFDFNGEFEEIEKYKLIRIALGDGRKMEVHFDDLKNGNVKVVEKFEPENQNPISMQKAGWQMILDNFKKICIKIKSDYYVL